MNERGGRRRKKEGGENERERENGGFFSSSIGYKIDCLPKILVFSQENPKSAYFKKRLFPSPIHTVVSCLTDEH